MQRTDLPQQIQLLLGSCWYAVLATVCADGTPWNSPVACSLDEQLNLYWASSQNSQHSRNILYQPTIFAVLFGGSNPALQGQGLYLQMHAKPLLSPAAVRRALRHYDASFFESHHADITFLGTCPTRLYRAKPLQIWCNTDTMENGYFVDRRQHWL